MSEVPLQLKDAAELLDMTPSGVRWLIDTNQLRAQRTPSGQRITWPSAVEQFRAERVCNSARRKPNVFRAL